MLKIALIGKCPMSQGLAPWDDTSWQKWTCSTVETPMGERWKNADVHFEMHNLDVAKRGMGREYLKFIKEHKKVYVPYLDPERVPNGVIYPISKILSRFRPHHLTSSHAYMAALAIDQILELPEEERKGSMIGCFGIDMTAKTEYQTQRPGFQNILLDGIEWGVNIGAPQQSDILQPPPLYGYEMFDPFWIKHNARLTYIKGQHDELSKQQDDIRSKMDQLASAYEVTTYELRFWAGRGQHEGLADAPDGGSSPDQTGIRLSD